MLKEKQIVKGNIQFIDEDGNGVFYVGKDKVLVRHVFERNRYRQGYKSVFRKDMWQNLFVSIKNIREELNQLVRYLKNVAVVICYIWTQKRNQILRRIN